MTQQIRGLVLRTVDVGDYDCVLTLLTAQEGKISVFARGAQEAEKSFFGSVTSCFAARTIPYIAQKAAIAYVTVRLCTVFLRCAKICNDWRWRPICVKWRWMCAWKTTMSTTCYS